MKNIFSSFKNKLQTLHINLNIFIEITCIFQNEIQYEKQSCFTFLLIPLFGLIEDTVFSRLFLYSICCDTLFWLNYIRKICPYTDMQICIWKKEPLIDPLKGLRTLGSLDHTLKTAAPDFFVFIYQRALMLGGNSDKQNSFYCFLC